MEIVARRYVLFGVSFSSAFLVFTLEQLACLIQTSNLPRALHVGQMNVIKNDVVVILLFPKNMVLVDFFII